MLAMYLYINFRIGLVTCPLVTDFCLRRRADSLQRAAISGLSVCLLTQSHNLRGCVSIIRAVNQCVLSSELKEEDDKKNAILFNPLEAWCSVCS